MFLWAQQFPFMPRKIYRIAVLVFFALISLLKIPLDRCVNCHDAPGGVAFCTEHNNPSYEVCNGLCNQLLSHAAHISNSIQTQSPVRIPDVFIVNGVQNEFDKAKGELKPVAPSNNNSIPLSAVIDSSHLLQTIRNHGVHACFVPYESVLSQRQETFRCQWLDQLSLSDNVISLEVVNAMKPALGFAYLVNCVLQNLSYLLNSMNFTLHDGICLHHRNGADWKNHCQTWKGNNCMEIDSRSIGALVFERIPQEYRRKWLYYIDDNSEVEDSVIRDFRGHQLTLFSRDKDRLLSVRGLQHFLSNIGAEIPQGNYRDILAAVDFFVCDHVGSFIGNSVSTFSALQIAKRSGKNCSWYNSRGIPLAASFGVYYLPIIYTYTELSQVLGKSLLKTSILSVRRVFGLRLEVHVLYHGHDDTDFLTWLESHEVIIHRHMPWWSSAIENMRVRVLKEGRPQTSHLFRHSGNYLGTWQRIDIPLFINAEYGLFLDSDTVVHDCFSLAEFGFDITSGIAFSNEAEEHLIPANAGVALMNIPKLRQTYDDFLQFILNHTGKDFIMGPSDQGAYLGFYGNAEQSISWRDAQAGKCRACGPNLRFLDTRFNFKPYYKSRINLHGRKVVHFHGLKPHEILIGMMGAPVEHFLAVLRPLVNTILRHECMESVCQSLHDFSVALLLDEENTEIYCNITLGEVSAEKAQQCMYFFSIVASTPKVDCVSLAKILSLTDMASLLPTPVDCPKCRGAGNYTT